MTNDEIKSQLYRVLDLIEKQRATHKEIHAIACVLGEARGDMRYNVDGLIVHVKLDKPKSVTDRKWSIDTEHEITDL